EPLQALPYLPPSQEAWPAVIRVLAAVATIYAVLILSIFVAQIGMTFASTGSNVSGLGFRFTDVRSALVSGLQLLGGVAGAIVLCGSIGQQSARPAARLLMLVGLSMTAGADLLVWLSRM